VIAEIKAAGLRGRGGAAFPTGVKWRGVATSRPEKYVVCNADESEPGTFKDRVIMEGDPFAIVEALTIAGLTVGARTGFIYIRGEYPVATRRLRNAIAQAEAAGLLGDDVGVRADRSIELRRGQGAYICGEETALFNSIEGFRGEPRQKPPFPTSHGLFGKPTVINNVETLVNVNRILSRAAPLSPPPARRVDRHPLWCLSGDVARPGCTRSSSEPPSVVSSTLAGGVVGELGHIMLGGSRRHRSSPDRLDVRLTFEDSRPTGPARIGRDDAVQPTRHGRHRPPHRPLLP
jgi:NADH-quinone oxidoreductase subunit F